MFISRRRRDTPVVLARLPPVVGQHEVDPRVEHVAELVFVPVSAQEGLRLIVNRVEWKLLTRCAQGVGIEPVEEVRSDDRLIGAKRRQTEVTIIRRAIRPRRGPTQVARRVLCREPAGPQQHGRSNNERDKKAA